MENKENIYHYHEINTISVLNFFRVEGVYNLTLLVPYAPNTGRIAIPNRLTYNLACVSFYGSLAVTSGPYVYHFNF